MTKNKIGKASKKDEILKAYQESQRELGALKKSQGAPENAAEPTPPPVPSESAKEDEYVDIRPDAYIQVVSLCPHKLTLSTAQTGGKSFKFKKLGDVKRILYRDLVDIVEHMPTFAESGTFYILNEDVVRMHGLEDYYDKVLGEEKINLVLSADAETAFTVFQSSNHKQKHFIAEMLMKKIIADEEGIDMNFVRMVERELDMDIISKAEESKVYREEILEK